jgi:predicted Rossmann fold flavoprotein
MMHVRKLDRMLVVPDSTDIVIVGAGAAGLATAIFARRRRPDLTVLLLDGAARPGAKILVSGGGRCNVTNAVVTASDFWGATPPVIRRVLKALPVDATVALFADLGVALHEEPDGKLFPDSHRARDVLDALLRGVQDAGARLAAGVRVHGVGRQGHAFVLDTSAGAIRAGAVVLATGGRSLPKTGSDGGGYRIAEALGHTLVPQTPALAPLLLDADAPGGVHRELSGVSVDGEIAVWVDGVITTRLRGALLWTHFGISGPLALNASRHWARATGRRVSLSLSLYPEARFEDVDAMWIRAAVDRPSTTLRRMLGARVPDAMAGAVLRALSLPADRALADLTRDDRRRLVHAVTGWPLPVLDTRGYNYAEVTAGGVPLAEVDPATMQSRVCPGLYFAGEILDVDGRIGGFNFQWAWCTAALAGRAVSASTPPLPIGN